MTSTATRRAAPTCVVAPATALRMGPLPPASSLTWLSGYRMSCDRSYAACTTVEEQAFQHIQTWLLEAKCMFQWFATPVFSKYSPTIIRPLTSVSTIVYPKDERTDAMTLRCRTCYPARWSKRIYWRLANASVRDCHGSSFPRSRNTRVGGVMLQHFGSRSRVPRKVVT